MAEDVGAPRGWRKRISACAPSLVPSTTVRAHAHLFFPTAIGLCGLAWNDIGLTAFALPGRDVAGTAGVSPPAGAEDPALCLEKAPAWIRELVAQVRGTCPANCRTSPACRWITGRCHPSPGAFMRRPGPWRPARPALWRAGRDDGGAAGASRAIGAALGANPWSLIVPCHRILGAKGRLTGFSAAGGVVTKARLLVIEGAQLLAE